MPAYVIVDIDVFDRAKYKEYVALTPATIAKYDGRFVVRGGAVDKIEGEWEPGRIVILEFPSMERAKQWWDSPEYAPAKAIRQSVAKTNMIMVNGFQPSA